MAKSLARVPATIGASASVTLALAGCHSKPSPPIATDPAATSSPATTALPPVLGDAAIANPAENTAPDASAALPTWRDKKRATSPDGAVAFDYPSNVFKTVSAKGASVTLNSGISEPGMSGKGDRLFYTLTITKMTTSKLDAIKKLVDPDSAKKLFPDGTEKSFVPLEGFVDAEVGVNGAKGYRVTMGVEGIGDSVQMMTTHDGISWQLDCRFCCGMVLPPPKITAEEQITLCEDVMHAFEAEH